MEDRAGGGRGLQPTIGAHPQPRAGPPAATTAAVWAREPLRPAHSSQILPQRPSIGDASVKGNRYLLAAGEQEKLWNLAEALYRNQGAENSGWLTEDVVRKLAAQTPRLDVDRLPSGARAP